MTGRYCRAVAAYNNVIGFKESWRTTQSLRAGRLQPAGPFLESRVVHIPDVPADEEYNPPDGALKQAQKLGQYRTLLVVPSCGGDDTWHPDILEDGSAPFTDSADRAGQDLRRPGGDCDRERTAVRRGARRARAISPSLSSSRPRLPTCSRSSAARRSISQSVLQTLVKSAARLVRCRHVSNYSPNRRGVLLCCQSLRFLARIRRVRRTVPVEPGRGTATGEHCWKAESFISPMC